MSAFSWPCQVALKSALGEISLPDITDLAKRIFDISPQITASFPYLQIGDSDVTPVDAGSGSRPEQSDDGVSEDIDIHVWHRGHEGKKIVKQISDAIHDRLHGSDLGVAGRASSLTWVTRIHVAVEPDGETTRAVVSINVIHRSP